jgi:hypothetical protein
MWTHFWDMHSGGDLKEEWGHIYIEAPQEEAEVIFYNRFGHNPNRVTCTCCGEDYSISEGRSLGELTKYHREYGGKKNRQSIESYTQDPNVLVIRKDEIQDSEREGTLPTEGYVWV